MTKDAEKALLETILRHEENLEKVHKMIEAIHGGNKVQLAWMTSMTEALKDADQATQLLWASVKGIEERMDILAEMISELK